MLRKAYVLIALGICLNNSAWSQAGQTVKSGNTTEVLTWFMAQFPRESCDKSPSDACIALMTATGDVVQIPDKIAGNEQALLDLKIDGHPLVPDQVRNRITANPQDVDLKIQEPTRQQLLSTPSLIPKMVKTQLSVVGSSTSVPTESSTVPSWISYPQPATPPTRKSFSKSFWVAGAVLAAGIVADAESTKYAEGQGGRELNSWLFGSVPSRARMYSISGGAGAVLMWAVYRAKKDNPDRRYELFPLAIGILHGSVGLRNYLVFRK